MIISASHKSGGCGVSGKAPVNGRCMPAIAKQVDFSDKLVLSIAAGVQVARFYALLGNKLNLVRIMPNTPSLVGKE